MKWIERKKSISVGPPKLTMDANNLRPVVVNSRHEKRQSVHDFRPQGKKNNLVVRDDIVQICLNTLSDTRPRHSSSMMVIN